VEQPRRPLRSRAVRGLPFCLITCAVVALSLGAPRAFAQAADEKINAYDVSVDIQRDGSIVVAERIDYDFGFTQHHGIIRNIPARFHYDDRNDRVYPLRVLSVVGSPGTPDEYEVNKSGSEIQIKIGDPDRTISGEHTYTITYRVEGALNGFADHDELYWNAIGTEWGVPIEAATVAVRAPVGLDRVACFAGPLGSNRPCQGSDLQGDSATFTHQGLSPYEAVTVVVGFPRGTVPPPTPILEERWSLARAFSATPMTLGVGGALLALLLAGVGYLLWANGRDRRAIGSPVDIAYAGSGEGEQPVPLFERGTYPVEYAPPDDIRPGQVGTLIDEVANPLDVTATIVDLAVRGYLRIEEIPKRWVLGKPDWRLVKLNEADKGLMKYERLLLDGLFEDADEVGDDLFMEEGEEALAGQAEDADEVSGAPARPDLPAMSPPGEPEIAEVKLSALRKRFGLRLRKVQNALYEDAVKRRWFAGRPDKVRARWHTLGFVLLAVGVGLVWLAAATTHLGLLPVPVVLAGLVLAWAARWMPRRTPKGTGLVRRVLGFRTYIETAEAHEARFQERENIFSHYLPYAVVFGCTEKWARAFAGIDGQLPSTAGWYVGPYPFNVGGFTSSIDHFSSVAAGTITSAAATGSSGFSGGGFSGGGGGGGGGGSW
jgi:uncharacterized membrane protein YgcG